MMPLSSKAARIWRRILELVSHIHEDGKRRAIAAEMREDAVMHALRIAAMGLGFAGSACAPPTDAAPAPSASPAAPAGRPPPKTVQSYVRVSTPRVVLAHIRVVDGTGHSAAADRNVVV